MIIGFITLPWPPSALWPNSRKDRRASTAIRAKARQDGWAACMEAGFKIPEDAHLHMLFCPPTKRRWDLDNALSACKAALDGMAKASGVDDSGWSYTISRRDVVEHGAVYVRVEMK